MVWFTTPCDVAGWVTKSDSVTFTWCRLLTRYLFIFLSSRDQHRNAPDKVCTPPRYIFTVSWYGRLLNTVLVRACKLAKKITFTNSFLGTEYKSHFWDLYSLESFAGEGSRSFMLYIKVLVRALQFKSTYLPT